MLSGVRITKNLLSVAKIESVEAKRCHKLFVIIKTNFFKKDIHDSADSVLGMIPEIRFVETRDAIILGCSDF